AGILVPIGISTDDTTKFFFGHLIENQSLVQLVGFENEEFIFPEVHHSFKFCALTMSGINVKNKSTDFVFFCRKYSDISQRLRHFELTHTDFVKINPNTLTCPIFRTHIDAELTKKIYYRNSVLVNEQFEKNEFYVSFFSMFHMSNDSNLFQVKSGPNLTPLLEAKMIQQFDHRYGTYQGATQANLNQGNLPLPSDAQKKDPNFLVLPQYWVPKKEVLERLQKWNKKWLLVYRGITSSVVEHT